MPWLRVYLTLLWQSGRLGLCYTFHLLWQPWGPRWFLHFGGKLISPRLMLLHLISHFSSLWLFWWHCMLWCCSSLMWLRWSLRIEKVWSSVRALVWWWGLTGWPLPFPACLVMGAHRVAPSLLWQIFRHFKEYDTESSECNFINVKASCMSTFNLINVCIVTTWFS